MNAAVQKEVNISAVLNLIPYLDYNFKLSEGKTLKYIVENYDTQLGGNEYFEALKQAVNSNPDIANIELVDQSCNHPDSSWSNSTDPWTDDLIQGCTFKDADGNYYVAFRGTGDGRWRDNGKGMAAPSTEMQEAAAAYFDEMAEKYLIDASNEGKRITVTGHSKGGNEAQYTYMMAKHEEIIDSCISLDGQGFSGSAEKIFKKKYGNEYMEKLQNMYSVNGQNDYVHGLGIPIIPKENTYFVPTTGNTMEDYHCLLNMVNDENGTFTGLSFIDPETGTYYEQGDLGKFVDELSERMMKLDPEDLEGAAILVMSFIDPWDDDEALGSIKDDPTNWIDLLAHGAPVALETLLLTPEGWALLGELIKYSYEEIYEKYGIGGVIGLTLVAEVVLVFLAINIVKIAVVGLTVYIILNVLDFVIDTAKMLYEKISEYLDKLREFCQETINKIVNGIRSHTSGSKEAKENPKIEVNTIKLRDYASRINEVNRRISRIDGRLDSLYLKVGLRGLWDLMQADILTSYSLRLKSASGYLTQTANKFEKAEKEIESYAK